MSLNKNEVSMILTLVDMSLKYGIPLVEKTIENLNKETISHEDIKNLKIDAEWEDYFDEK